MRSSDLDAAPLDRDRPDPWAVGTRQLHGRSGNTGLNWAIVAALGGVSGPVIRLAVGEGDGRGRAIRALIAMGLLLELSLRMGGIRTPWAFVGLGAAAAAVGLVTPTFGRAPGIVAVAGVIVADAVLIEWRPLPTWPRRQHRTAALAVPFLVATEISWIRSGSNGLVVVLLAATLAVVEAHHRLPALTGRATRRTQRMVTAAAGVLAGVALFAVVAPTLYLGGAITRLITWGRSPFRRTAGSRWTDRDTSLAEERKDAASPFSSAPAPLRHRRNVLGAILIVILVAGTILAVDVRRSPDPAFAGRSGSLPG